MFLSIDFQFCACFIGAIILAVSIVGSQVNKTKKDIRALTILFEIRNFGYAVSVLNLVSVGASYLLMSMDKPKLSFTFGFISLVCIACTVAAFDELFGNAIRPYKQDKLGC